MSALQTINLGTAPTGSDGDPVRTAFTKDNANVAVLQTQETLTSVALITSAQALTIAHIGKRVNINLSSAGTINLPAASMCLVDQVTLLRNLGSTIVTLAITAASGDSLTVSKLNPGESALFDTDGIHTWNCLMRGRTSSDNETVNGNCTVVGNETVGGTLTVTGASVLTGGITGGPNFSARPTFASNVPWDSANFTPNSYAALNSSPHFVGEVWGTTNIAALGTSTAALLRCDGTNAYLLSSSSASTSFNSLRPLRWSLGAGDLYLDGTGAGLRSGPGGNFKGTGGDIQLSSGPGPLYVRCTGATSGLYSQMGPDASNSILMYDQSGNGLFKINGANTWGQTSDETLKNIRREITDAVARVSTLRTVMATWKYDDAYNEAHGFPDDAAQFACVIAQDVKKIMPEATPDVPGHNGYIGVQYTDLIPLALAAIKELGTSMKSLSARVTAMESAK